ncbi:MAG: hypothetical protein R3E68_19770 [Burkholderiaceae bacterium]
MHGRGASDMKAGHGRRTCSRSRH